MDLSAFSIRRVHQGLVAKEFSAEELALAYLDRIDQHNAALNAYVTVTREYALAQAREVDKKIVQGGELGILEGVPFAIKDLFNTRGIKTTCASPGLKTFVPPYDATSVARLKAAGMVVLGKTNLDEFACGA